MNNFFITGLPRSRTAWFAAYLSAHPDTWCWHEGLKGCYSKRQFINKMQPWGVMPAEMNVGNADSVLPLTDYQDLFPHSYTIVIHRAREEVLESLRALLGDVGRDAIKMVEDTERAMDKLQGFHIAYSQLDNVMPSLVQWLGIEYRQDIHTLYKGFNIQTLDLAPDPEALAVWRG